MDTPLPHRLQNLLHRILHTSESPISCICSLIFDRPSVHLFPVYLHSSLHQPVYKTHIIPKQRLIFSFSSLLLSSRCIVLKHIIASNNPLNIFWFCMCMICTFVFQILISKTLAHEFPGTRISIL